MKLIILVIFYLTIFTSQASWASKISVDMDILKNDIQPAYYCQKSGETLSVCIYIENVANCYSYQFSVQFDTTKFSFLGADKDIGLSGPKNILTSRGGTVQGLCQIRQNPLSRNIIDYSYTILTEDSSLTINGSGLAGAVLLKSKVQTGDSTSIKIIDAYTAELHGQVKIPIDTLETGMFFDNTTFTERNQHTSDRVKSLSMYVKSNNNGTVEFTFAGTFHNAVITLGNLRGEQIKKRFLNHIDKTPVSFSKLTSGIYVLSISSENIIRTAIIKIKK